MFGRVPSSPEAFQERFLPFFSERVCIFLRCERVSLVSPSGSQGQCAEFLLLLNTTFQALHFFAAHQFGPSPSVAQQ